MRHKVAIVTATIKMTALILKKNIGEDPCTGRDASILGAGRYPHIGGLAGNTRCSRTRTTSGNMVANFAESQQERDSIALRLPLSSWMFTVATRGLCI
jgi:hypothetical protein